MNKNPIATLISSLIFLILSPTNILSATEAYPRAQDVFLHVADYGRTGVYAEQFLRAFDVLSYSILVLTLAFIAYAIIQILNIWTNIQQSRRLKKRRGDVDDDQNSEA